MFRNRRLARGAGTFVRARMRGTYRRHDFSRVRPFAENVVRLELAPEAVAAVADPVGRNRLITRSYGEISRRFRDLLGPDAGANWCTFAAWASRRAGRTIRGEDCNALFGWLWYALTLGDLDRERARVAVAEGNLRVYHEIALQFVRFLRWFGGRRRPDPDRLEAFLRWFRPGDPDELDAAGRPGQGLLRDAFRNYHRALYAAGAARRQGYTFLANLQVALHEQSHLQDAIARAMPRAGWLRRWTTSVFVGLPLPGGERTPVARDLAGPAAPHLRRIENPATHELMRRFGVTESGPGGAASDWADLGQRMRFIITLMRVHHDDSTLFLPPE